jgi:hypothetical protein|tara:strand:+ start:123 stop:278 length:156 start_codon:yes stop_codon:yes gene_type:complete
MVEAKEQADNIQITIADLKVVMTEYPEIIKPLKIAAMVRIKNEETNKKGKK